MDNSNIIISIIIVLCIAAGVTAYGISEGDNAVFNDLTGFSPDSSSDDSNGIDLSTDDATDGTGSDTSSGSSSSSSSSSGSSSGSSGGTHSNGGSNSGSSGGSGSGGNGGGNSSSNSTSNKISPGEAKTIATGFIGEEGAYVSSVKDDTASGMYICYISNANGTVVDAIGISYTGENLGKV